ncbi:MAG: DUF4143 domain-containing protein [Thermodesulfobacteriota bacterium]|nr:DUF4143 domain-containing protein [Thermodesulfobacteriota bacterium]
MTPPYLGNRSSRLIKSPKRYLSNAGLAGYLAGLEPSSSIRTDPLYGAMFETHVAQNLLSILCHNGEDGVNLGPRLWALPISLILS